jgi:hypothetical protein
MQRYATFAAEHVAAFATWHDAPQPLPNADDVAVAARQKRLPAVCHRQPAADVVHAMRLADAHTVRARVYTRLSRVQLAAWLAAETDAVVAKRWRSASRSPRPWRSWSTPTPRPTTPTATGWSGASRERTATAGASCA